MQKNHRLSLALALALGSSEALALGLGGIRVSSSLNEPLVAEIPIISSAPGEIDQLKVKLASADAFSRVGIDRAALLPANLEFSVVKNAAGQPIVRVTTANKLGEPILNFLLEVEWGRGRMLREYTVLLDPPRVAPARTAPAVTAPARESAPAPAQSLPAPMSAPKPPAPMSKPASPAPAAPSASSAPIAKPAPATTPIPAAPAPVPSAAVSNGQYGPVASGDTLWSIAQQVRPDSGVSMNQTMLALLRANPDAFIGNNINRLKRGAVLRIPTRDELSALTAAAAAAEVSEQARAWRDAPAGSTPASVSMPAEPVASVESTASKPVSSATTPASRLELLPPGGDKPATGAQSGSADGGAGKELRADLNLAREQVATLAQENRDLRSRVTDLERIDGDTKRLIELKDSQLADAQRRLAELEAARDGLDVGSSASAAMDDAGSDATAALADEDSATDAVDDTLSSADDATIMGSDEIADDAGMDDMVPAGAPPVAVDAPPSVQAVADPAPAETQALDSAEPAASVPWYMQPWAMLAGLGVLVAGLIAFLLSRRRSKVVAEPRESIADSYIAATSGAAYAADARGDEDSELERLLVAVGEQPNDLGRHLALVGYYYRQSDASGFEGAAEAMYAQLYDADHPSWRQVVAMGRDLLPDHPLFFDVPETPELRSEPEAFAPTGRYAETPPTSASSVSEADDDWGHSPPAAAADTTQNFSVDDIDRLRVAAAARPFETQPLSVPEINVTGYDVDAGTDFGTDADGDSDEAAATKLELARAYLDMGDVEGARGMLEEVVGEGNPGQRAEARRLLDDIR